MRAWAAESPCLTEVSQRGFHCGTEHGRTAEAAVCPKHVIMHQRGVWQTKKWITEKGEKNAWAGVFPNVHFEGTSSVASTRRSQLETKNFAVFLSLTPPRDAPFFSILRQLWQQSGSSHGFFVLMAGGKFHEHSDWPCTQSQACNIRGQMHNALVSWEMNALTCLHFSAPACAIQSWWKT